MIEFYKREFNKRLEGNFECEKLKLTKRVRDYFLEIGLKEVKVVYVSLEFKGMNLRL